jgi:hypothetical protein
MFKFQKTGKKEEPKDMKEVLKELSSLEEKLRKVSDELEAMKENQRLCAQKVALNRYNPFGDVGGDQSFTLVMLDKDDSGIAVTSLFNRDGNRIYGKTIKNGASEYVLSEEEKKTIEKAKNNGNK